jgi:uncharacterized protein YjdB
MVRIRILGVAIALCLACMFAGCPGVTPEPTTVSVTGVSLDSHELSLTVGHSASLAASILPATATDPAVSWASSKPAVAAVSASGEVTALVSGEAVITVKSSDGGLSDYCLVSVSDPEADAVDVGVVIR